MASSWRLAWRSHVARSGTWANQGDYIDSFGQLAEAGTERKWTASPCSPTLALALPLWWWINKIATRRNCVSLEQIEREFGYLLLLRKSFHSISEIKSQLTRWMPFCTARLTEIRCKVLETYFYGNPLKAELEPKACDPFRESRHMAINKNQRETPDESG